MASSRLEKIGTIFTRVNGLLKSGAMKWEDRPIWYDIFKACPPKDDPKYDRPAPDISVPGIFYEEDKIRAQFHNNNKNLGTVNMFNNETQTKTKKFIQIYKKLEESDSVPADKLYDNAVEMLNREYEKSSETNLNETGIASSFKEAQEQKQLHKIDVSKIFKE
ncbi:mitochondrial ribosomal protein S23 [Carabus blaptoides fortunei]